MAGAAHARTGTMIAVAAFFGTALLANAADNSHLYQPLDERGRQRQDDERLAAQAQRDREQRALEEEKQRLQRRERSRAVIDAGTTGCVIKPVMTDEETAACRK